MDQTRRVGRPPKSEAGDTKADLLAAALSLFARNGYAGTSIRAIAREVGLSESVLYSHFRSKQEIYQAALAVAGPQSAITAVGELGSDPLARTDPAASLAALAERMFAMWDRPQARQLASLIARDSLLHDATLSGGIDAAVARLAAVFTEWMADGRIRAGLGSAEDLAFALLAPIAHARMRWLHADATPQQRAAARDRFIRHARLFAAAMLSPPATAG